LYRDQKAVNRVALVPPAVPVPCGEFVTSVQVPPFWFEMEMAWFAVSRNSSRMSLL
jgi:hypothetical protein